MRTHQDIESYLIKTGMRFEPVGDGTWVVHDEDQHLGNIVVRHDPPILVCRVKIMELPRQGDHTKLYRQLLELNASEMMGGAYGLEGSAVVATHTLQAENLDYNEFQAAIDGLTLSISDHFLRLGRFMDKPVIPGGTA